MTNAAKTLQPTAAIARTISGPMFARERPIDNVPIAQMTTPAIAISAKPFDGATRALQRGT
jgi:hypothetical protein